MSAARTHTLPGVRFGVEPSVVSAALPRMDVAAFVGFAACGPLHVPVPVEDPVQFRDVFGEDLPLARDGEGRRMQASLLGPSVELFFRNGGRRCWVVRVGREPGEGSGDGAQTQAFRVPGLYRADAPFGQARILARSPGAWADRLRVGARLVGRPLASAQLELGTGPKPYHLRLAASAVVLEAGDLVELRVMEAGLRLYLFAEALASERGGVGVRAATGYWFDEPAVPGSPPGSPSPSELPGGLLPLDDLQGLAAWTGWGSPPPGVQARLLRMELLVWSGERLESQLGELGFDPAHARYWDALPDDAALYRQLIERRDGALGLPLPALWRDAHEPRRFPLAGAAGGVRYLPLGMSVRRSPQDAVLGEHAFSGAGLGVEGLASFSADPFLDPDLGTRTSATLVSEAKHKRLVRRAPLLGIHSLLPIEEVSLIAVPDAGHRPWDRRPKSNEPTPAEPWLDPVGAADERGRRALTWSAVPGARRYLVEQSGSPEFEAPLQSWIEPPDPLEMLDAPLLRAPATLHRVSLLEDCPTKVYFRVRAIGRAEVSVWSNTQVLRLPEGGFRGCSQPAVETLSLRLDVQPGTTAGRVRAVWTGAATALRDPLVEGFELQLGRAADFLEPEEAYRGIDRQVELALPTDLRAYYRVRALTATGPGPWSNTRIVEPRTLSADTSASLAQYDPQDLLAIHCALVRLCAARADCLGLLSLPAHYRAEAVAAHLDALMPATGERGVLGTGQVHVRTLGEDEAALLSHAALFHPWVRHPYNGPEGTRQVAAAPPDGAVLGAIAARSIARGTWISPANEPLFDVLGLTPALAEDAAADLLQRPVNLLGRAPRGFLMAKADTLSADEELRPLTVRRFLHLLRRLIERDGPRYVFEPNDEDFRDAVRAQWEDLLQDLHGRGALRGAQPASAFRVVIDPTGEAVRAPDSGRLIVELHVAPARPLRFINVRLIQAGPEGLVVQEV